MCLGGELDSATLAAGTCCHVEPVERAATTGVARSRTMLLDAKQRAGNRLGQLTAGSTACMCCCPSVTRHDHQKTTGYAEWRQEDALEMPCAARGVRVHRGNVW